jgi:hypothetical protein
VSDDDELPRDPDWDDVPEELALLDGERVTVIDEDGVGPATLVVVPQMFAHARRLRDGEPD